jgi:hypothetical protein
VNACVHTYTKPRTSSTRSRGLGRRIHGSVEDTKLSTNKQLSLSLCENVEDCVHSNDHVHLHGDGESMLEKVEDFLFHEGTKEYSAPCVVGRSRRGWPKRDINKIVFKSS